MTYTDYKSICKHYEDMLAKATCEDERNWLQERLDLVRAEFMFTHKEAA